MPFVDKTGGKYGQTATDELAIELALRADEFKPPIDVVPSESVTRTIETLTLPSPVTDDVSIARVGQELRAQTLLKGEVWNYRVMNVDGGKVAQVIMRVEAINVASMLAVNGAAIQSTSPIRPASTSDDKLIAEAVKVGAQESIAKILSQTLPSGTVLNTVGDNALINQGTRAGFRTGQKVVITRGREQVATAKVTGVEFDQADLDITHYTKGVAPGDTVQVIYDTPVPEGGFGQDGPKLHKVKAHSNNAALVSIALVLALGVFLVMNSSNNSPFGGVTAEAALYPDSSGQPSVKVSWRPDLFAKGLSQRYAFQVWRNDLTTSPVVVTDGSTTFAYDLQTELPIPNWYNFNGIIGTQGLNFTAPPSAGTVTPTGLTPGKPYIYSVELVYDLSQNDLPGTVTTGGGSSGTTSTSSGTTSTGTTSTSSGTTSTSTGTTTTGTTTGTTTTGTTGTTTTGTTSTSSGTTSTSTSTGSTSTGGSAVTYYFVSGRTYSKLATPLARIQLVSPANNAVVTAPLPFTFDAVATAANPIVVQYVIQFSADSSFPAGGTYTLTPFQRTDTGVIGTQSIDTTSSSFPASVRNASIVWWRVGARNPSDSPGPVQDASGDRYVFCAPRAFSRPTNSPPGAASVKRTH